MFAKEQFICYRPKRLGPPSLHLPTCVVLQPCTQSEHPSAPIHILSTLILSDHSSMRSSNVQVQICEAHKLHLWTHFVRIYTSPMSIYRNTKLYCWGTSKKIFHMKPRIYLESYCQAVMYFPLRNVCSGRYSKYSEGQEKIVQTRRGFPAFCNIRLSIIPCSIWNQNSFWLPPVEKIRLISSWDITCHYCDSGE